MPQYGTDSQWIEPNPDNIAAVRTLLYVAEDGNGDWGFTEDRRDADGWMAQDGNGNWGIDTTLSSGTHAVEIGGLVGVKV